MPTNEERREVASRLRGYLSYAKKHDADKDTDPCIHGNKMFRNIAQAVGGGISNIIDTYEETLIQLIEFIEPEPERTCTVYPFGCTDSLNKNCQAKLSCGHEVLGRTEDISYCPKCGAKVVER